MCGRFVLDTSKAALENLFEAAFDEETGLVRLASRFNIAPTEPVLIVHELTSSRRFDFARWGLVPHWAKNPAEMSLLINARIETVLEKPSFRAGSRHKRCLVPATGFYEWRREGKLRQPYGAARVEPDGENGLFAFAGIMDDWTGPDGEVMTTLAILTQDAAGAVADIHHRMPVVVPPGHYASWLDVKTVTADRALEPLRPVRSDGWRIWPVDRRVNRAGIDGADLWKRVELPDKNDELEAAKPDEQLKLF